MRRNSGGGRSCSESMSGRWRGRGSGYSINREPGRLGALFAFEPMGTLCPECPELDKQS
jgi:hypothetical protein